VHDGSIGERHHDRQAQAGSVVDRLHHEQESLARRGRVRPCAGGGRADRHRHRSEFRLDVDELTRRQFTGLHHGADRFDDVRLGEMGYAQTTSGLQRATVSATALDPSICCSTFELLFGPDDQLVGRRGGHDVSFCGGAREALADGERYGLEGDLRGERREAAEQHGIGQGRPRCSSASSVAGQVRSRSRWNVPKKSPRPSSSTLLEVLINT